MSATRPEQESPNQQTGDRAAFDKRFDVKALASSLCDQINNVLGRLDTPVTLTVANISYNVERAAPEGYWELSHTPEGAENPLTKQEPITTETMNVVLGQLFARIQ